MNDLIAYVHTFQNINAFELTLFCCKQNDFKVSDKGRIGKNFFREIRRF